MNKAIKLAYLNAIVDKLWLKGLITEEEKKKLYKKNAEKIA